MNSLNDSLYRLDLARGYLIEAKEEYEIKRWYGCLAGAQEAVENEGKSIVAHFRPVPATHEVIELIAPLIGSNTIPETIADWLAQDLDAFRDMGIKTHIRVTYGDEKARITPWELIQQPEAETGLAKAIRAVALAERVYEHMARFSTKE